MQQSNLTPTKRVLSVQSSVVCGHVGNKSATFPLQLLGWEVQHSLGYGRWGGSKFDAAHLEDIFSALDANGLLRQSHMLTGYVPGAEALIVVSKTVDRLRAINPNLVYVLDPVMGDDGRIYVSESVIPVYKSLMLKATCATPNYFEAELLTDVKIIDAQSLKLALMTFHTRYGIPNVIISAVSLPLDQIELLGISTSAKNESKTGKLLVCAGSSMVPSTSGSTSSSFSTITFGIAFPELAEAYTGVGDAFSALILARFPPIIPNLTSPHHISPLALDAELAIASLQGILRHTREYAVSLTRGREELLIAKEGEDVDQRVRRLRMVELRLVQSQQEILNPDVRYPAVRF